MIVIIFDFIARNRMRGATNKSIKSRVIYVCTRFSRGRVRGVFEYRRIANSTRQVKSAMHPRCLRTTYTGQRDWCQDREIGDNNIIVYFDGEKKIHWRISLLLVCRTKNVERGEGKAQ